ARLGGLAEVVQQLDAAALDGLAEGEHGVEVHGLAAAVGGIPLAAVDHLAEVDDVLQAVDEPGGGREAVAPGASRLLVVALDGLGEVQVGDEADVGLVEDRKSTRLNSSHVKISYAVFCLKKKSSPRSHT